LSIIGWGWNVFAGLLLALSTSVLLAFGRGFSALTVAQSLHEGLTGMNDILILFLFVGALSQLLRVQGGTEQLADKIRQMSGGGKHEYVLAGLVSLFDILLANNTLAILLCGDLARRTARTFSIPPHRSAYLLDTFSCVFQGILPYGAQILLASRLSGVPILTLSSKVYYCHFLFLVAIVEIYLHQKYSEESQRSPHSK
jgi:Na+/H+ antiporter NhaC